MKKELLQIRTKPETKELFQSLCKKSGLKNHELLEQMLTTYCSAQQQHNEDSLMLKKILEYSALAIKGITTLPKDEKQMIGLVNAESRFDGIITKKINDER